MPVNRPSPIKRTRRTKADMARIRDALMAVLEEDVPMTVRQCFYRAVGEGVIDKTEAEYKSTVCRLLTEMRRDGTVPWGWITDITRVMRKPETFNSLEHAVQSTAQHYRKAVWHDLDVRAEVWLEKDALAGVLFDVTSLYDVPLMVTRGYPSLSFLHGAGEYIRSRGLPTYIYYFGDCDPSGEDIPRKVEAGLREFAPDTEIIFERVAVLPEQIKLFNLPTRPTKKTDTRARKFRGESVELDAIRPGMLREICRGVLEDHIPDEMLETVKVAERSERDFLRRWASQVGGAAP